jgi:phosphate starvation-inducible PhoH-like protein
MKPSFVFLYTFLHFSRLTALKHFNQKLKPISRCFSLNLKKKILGVSSLIKTTSPFYKPKTANQKIYFNYLNDKNIPIVLGTGPAGTGKTLFACNQAVTSLKNGLVQKIILTRPIVSVEEELGFLPGNIMNKMDPWTRPLFDILLEYYQQKDIDSMLYSGILEIAPIAYMRGRTFKNAFIIADEMQNSSPNQMLMLITRIGEDSKLVITGDLKQSDKSTENGLSDFIKKYSDYYDYCKRSKRPFPNIGLVKMDNVDIQRSQIVSKIIDIYSHDPLSIKNIPDDLPDDVPDDLPDDEPTPSSTTQSKCSIVSLTNQSMAYIENDAAMIPHLYSRTKNLM